MKFRIEAGLVFKRELATRLGEEGRFFRDDLADGVGHFHYWEDGRATFFFVCPCGCKQACQLSVYTGETGHGWKWNGSPDKPTLHPSIQQLGPCRWHGHLTEGEWKPA